MPRAAQKKTPTPRPARCEITNDDVLLTTREAAELTKMSVAWFERHRWARTGPPFRRRGRSIRYVKRELLSWWDQEPV